MSQEELLDKINFTIGTIEARQFQMSKDNLRMESKSRLFWVFGTLGILSWH